MEQTNNVVGNPNSNLTIQKQKEDLLRQQQRQYLATKKARKIQILQQKKRLYGQSSSEEQDLSPRSPKKQNINKGPIDNNDKKSVSAQSSKEEKFTINIQIKKEWKKGFIQFKQNSLLLTEVSQSIQDLNHIGVYFEAKKQGQVLIKLIFKKQGDLEVNLGVPASTIHDSIPLHYYIFSRIISLKMKLMNIKYTDKPPLKAQITNKLITKSDIYGNLYKKSQFLGKWEQRLIVLNAQGLFSYRDPKDKPSMQILWKSVKQISTSFQIFQNYELIIKLSYGTQTSIALPVIHYQNTTLKNNWLFHIYRKSIKQ